MSACALLGILAGCRTSAPVPSPWESYIATVHPRAIQLTRTDHTVVRMKEPRVEGDSVVGVVDGQYAQIPLTDVTQVSAPRLNTNRTALALAGSGAVVAVSVFLLERVVQGTNGTPTSCTANSPNCIQCPDSTSC
jgi:hypothetical protein